MVRSNAGRQMLRHTAAAAVMINLLTAGFSGLLASTAEASPALVVDLASGNVMFAATGVTSGSMLNGVRRIRGGAVTHSIVMRSSSGTVRMVEGIHNFERKTEWSKLTQWG